MVKKRDEEVRKEGTREEIKTRRVMYPSYPAK